VEELFVHFGIKTSVLFRLEHDVNSARYMCIYRPKSAAVLVNFNETELVFVHLLTRLGHAYKHVAVILFFLLIKAKDLEIGQFLNRREKK
jgi:hypothetical protein